MAVVVVMVMVLHVMSLACPSQHCHMGEAALAVLQPVKQPVSDSLQQRVVRGGEERGAIPVPRLQRTASGWAGVREEGWWALEGGATPMPRLQRTVSGWPGRRVEGGSEEHGVPCLERTAHAWLVQAGQA